MISYFNLTLHRQSTNYCSDVTQYFDEFWDDSSAQKVCPANDFIEFFFRFPERARDLAKSNEPLGVDKFVYDDTDPKFSCTYLGRYSSS